MYAQVSETGGGTYFFYNTQKMSLIINIV
ncbi:hypothetical protein [Bacillus safensis]|nr:hypothetical protein [Bacillus safensis]